MSLQKCRDRDNRAISMAQLWHDYVLFYLSSMKSITEIYYDQNGAIVARLYPSNQIFGLKQR